MANYLFLDMDGVLNSNNLIKEWIDNKEKELQEKHPDLSYRAIYTNVRQAFGEEFKHSSELIFPSLVSILNRVLEEADIKIIWSTTWRIIREYRDIDRAREMLTRRGIDGKRLVGYTPDLSYFRLPSHEIRVDEIRNTITNKQFGLCKKSLIGVLDDMDLTALNNGRNIKVFKTHIDTGITPDIAEDMLNFYKGK